MADPSIRTTESRPPGDVPTLVVVGAASRDIDASDARGWRLGGTVSYAALCAARLGIRVRALIGVDQEAAAAPELDVLRAARVEVVLAPLAHGPVFENLVVGNARQQHVHGASDQIPVAALPDDWRQPDALLLGPVAAELGDDWADTIPASALVALAWQGLLREMRAGDPIALRSLTVTPLVARSDVLFVSAEDVVGGGPALDALIRDGQELFVTAGPHGAMRIKRVAGHAHMRTIPPLPRRAPVDTTGAGDTFLAAYVSARMSASQLVGTADEWRLDAVAAATASLVVAAKGLDAVPSLRAVCAAVLTPRA